MKKITSIYLSFLFLAGLTILSCGDNTPFEPPGGGNTGSGPITGTDIPPIYESFENDVTITRDGNFIVLETKSVPQHRSPYFPEGHPNYVPYSGSNPDFALGPYRLSEQNFVFRLPMEPTEATNKVDAPTEDVIGLGVNGVVFYGVPNADDIDAIDSRNGHVDENGVYHYHLNPTYIIENVGKEGLVGMMLDGYAIYGPEENGVVVTSSDLDEFHGHVGATFHEPDEIYHYHITYESPFILGTKFFGTTGTVTNQ